MSNAAVVASPSLPTRVSVASAEPATPVQGAQPAATEKPAASPPPPAVASADSFQPAAPEDNGSSRAVENAGRGVLMTRLWSARQALEASIVQAIESAREPVLQALKAANLSPAEATAVFEKLRLQVNPATSRMLLAEPAYDAVLGASGRITALVQSLLDGVRSALPQASLSDDVARNVALAFKEASEKGLAQAMTLAPYIGPYTKALLVASGTLAGADILSARELSAAQDASTLQRVAGWTAAGTQGTVAVGLAASAAVAANVAPGAIVTLAAILNPVTLFWLGVAGLGASLLRDHPKLLPDLEKAVSNGLHWMAQSADLAPGQASALLDQLSSTLGTRAVTLPAEGK